LRLDDICQKIVRRRQLAIARQRGCRRDVARRTMRNPDLESLHRQAAVFTRNANCIGAAARQVAEIATIDEIRTTVFGRMGASAPA